MEGTDIEWLVTLDLQSRSQDEHWYSAYIFLFPFLYLVVDYSLWNGTAHMQGGPSLLRSTSLEMPTPACPRLPEGHCEFHQVDTQGEPSQRHSQIPGSGTPAALEDVFLPVTVALVGSGFCQAGPPASVLRPLQTLYLSSRMPYLKELQQM